MVIKMAIKKVFKKQVVLALAAIALTSMTNMHVATAAAKSSDGGKTTAPVFDVPKTIDDPNNKIDKVVEGCPFAQSPNIGLNAAGPTEQAANKSGGQDAKTLK